jgi:spore maturation protein CgeB
VVGHITGAQNLQILFFGLTISSSWSNGHATPYRALLRALHDLNIKVVFYERDVPYYARHRDFDSCDYCELILYKDWEPIRESALRRARDSDVVVTASYLPEGIRITEELLEVAGPLHVFYDLDTPITLNRMRENGVDYLRPDLIPEFDLYLSFTGGSILYTLEQNFGARCALPLYGCVDPDSYVRVASQERFACDLSFMGTYAPDRADCIRELFLAAAGRLPQQSFLLAGSMYPTEWEWPAGLRRLEHVSAANHPALYSSSRATLNLTRGVMARSGYCPSGRFFEASACGTPLLTDEWEGLDSFFHVEQELLVVRSSDDVVEALKSPDRDLARMAARARERTLDEHSGRHRAKQLLAACEQAGHAKRVIAETCS